MSGQDVPGVFRFIHFIIQGQDHAAGISEHHIHIFFSQAFNYNLRAIQFHRAIPSHFIKISLPAGQAIIEPLTLDFQLMP
jgi:hypothetical protein